MSLRRFYLLAIGGLAALLAALLVVVLGGSRKAVLETSELSRRAAAAQVAARVDAVLSEAEVAVTGIDRQLGAGLLDPASPDGLEAALHAELLRHDRLTEVTFTSPAGQVCVTRARDGKIDVVRRPPTGDDSDPTRHPTYQTPAATPGRAFWSDLAFTELDATLPLTERRKTLTVQKGLTDRAGKLLGVVRAGLVSDDIDGVTRIKVSDDPADPHRIFLADRAGRLITRMSPADRFAVVDEDYVRVVSAHRDPVIAAALADVREENDEGDQPVVARMAIGGEDWLMTLMPLPDDRTQGWLVGIVVPERWYLGALTATRNRLLLLSALIAGAVLAGGALSLRAIRRGLGQVVVETARMRSFEFAPSPARSAFSDVTAALASLEVAKTALRAMGRYVPVELVRLLYRDGREPTLGGEAQEVSLLFTDIEGFTTLSEQLAPDQLAGALGRYLSVLAAAVQEAGGTVDKFIGDAVMALWNAPLPTPDHARRACRTALRAVAALDRLYASSGWEGLAPWVTRFGLHRDTVLVGHFGAPDRMSYTALGDGVNLAARIEGLNKVYGTRILVSETVRADAGDDELVFRRIDRVAVKGKRQPVEIHELLGRRGEVDRSPAHLAYERAFDAYLAGRFSEAQDGLDPADPPSRTLAARCRRLAAEPPADWDGVYRAETK